MGIVEKDLPQREAMQFDIVIVGAGPAGLSASIRLKQLASENGHDISVVVLEKGSEVGAHILSGAVIDPVGLNQLIPDWKAKGAPVETSVKEDRFLILGPQGDLRIPNFLLPPLMSNHGNYIVSLGALTRWLAEQAINLGVEIYPGFAATEFLKNKTGAVIGVATGDMGVDRSEAPKESFTRGMELLGKYVLLAEGARGSLSKKIIQEYNLEANHDPQKYGLGLKELWEVAPTRHHPGLVQHSFGWPLDNQTGGGSFLYHYGKNLVSVGFVVHLNYKNPYLSPYDEFQKFKTHPAIREVFEGGKRLAYGARAITEGGWQSLPKLAFPGGLLLGCSAGMVNVPRIKGSHNAIMSGIVAAESVFKALQDKRQHDELSNYERDVRNGHIGRDLKFVQNSKPMWSRLGTFLGVSLGGLDMWMRTILNGWSPFGTWRHSDPDYKCLTIASKAKEISYPKPDGILTFDKLTNVAFSGTNHEENQPIHLKLTDTSIPLTINLPKWAEPAQRYCPAGVYEVVHNSNGQLKFQINAQNCVHCKTCDIKDPSQNITWVCPEGGGGPNYAEM